jgi:hypothetical protein
MKAYSLQKAHPAIVVVVAIVVVGTATGATTGSCAAIVVVGTATGATTGSQWPQLHGVSSSSAHPCRS